MGSEYERVAEAIAEIMFGSSSAGRPVYALPDAKTLTTVLSYAGVVGHDAEALAAVVRPTLQLDVPGLRPFHWQAVMAEGHKSVPLETPVALPLLVLLAIAAEQMQADVNLAAHNYYSRLHRMLRVPANHHARVENDYRRNADLLWGSLNAWLEAWEGERGIPTAYAVGGHAFVGLPLSQAVVRQHDRASLHELFALEGMTPGLRVSPSDMSATIDPYATATPSPLSSHLSGLWRVAAARERIVDAACLELESWDGSGIEAIASTQRLAVTRLLAFLRTFPRKSIAFNLMLPYRSEGPDTARFELPRGDAVVPTVAGPGGSTRLSGVVGVSAESLVNERLDGLLGTDDSRPFGRRPKRVIPLRWDDLQGAFVEAERISLGEDCIVLARTDARHRVENHLAAHARPGWEELAELAGMPDGWLIYQHVQIISAPVGQVHLDLLPLAPRARTNLTLRGGFVLPGLLRKWSALEPPEVVALAAGAEMLDVRIYRGTHVDSEQLLVQESQHAELVVLPLVDHGLVDGEYFVAMFVDGGSQAVATALLRLRSADTPQFRVADVDIRLVYSPESSPRWPLTAGPARWTSFINGAGTVELPAHIESPLVGLREFAIRQRRTTPIAAPAVHIGLPLSSDSCLATGMHRFVLPPDLPGQARTSSIEGECTTCGLVKRFAGTPWAARKKDSARPAAPPPDIPPVVESIEPDFEVAFDALNHVGAASFGVFERIAAQVEGSGLFADSFLRRLEVVGHVDVARDEDLHVTEWAVNTSTLVPIGRDRWVLIGARSHGLLEKLAELLGSDGHILVNVDAGFTRVQAVGVPSASKLAELGVQVLEESPAMAIASALPHLSRVAASLKRIVVPKYQSAEFWDTTSASWQSAETLLPMGAYRLKDFGSTYVIRSSEDVQNGTVGIGNAQIVKHIANLWANDPLVGYHSRSDSVVTPLGADLPALYGRALSLCSGWAPREIIDHRMLQYPFVPLEVAGIVFDRVSQ